VQKEAQQRGQLDVCTNEKVTNLLMGTNDYRTKEVKIHKRNEQMRNVEITSFLPFEVFGRWFHARWCWKCSLHLLEAPPNWGGHPNRLEYHGSLLCNHP
jgi:hypothetical protein